MDNLDNKRADELWQAITIIEAQEQLKQIDVNCYPNYTKKSKDTIHKDLHKKAYPKNFEGQKKIISNKDFASFLR